MKEFELNEWNELIQMNELTWMNWNEWTETNELTWMICGPHLEKVVRTGQFLTIFMCWTSWWRCGRQMKWSSRCSRAHTLSTTFRIKPRNRGPRTATLPAKNIGFCAREFFSAVNSLVPDGSHFPTTWWWCDWHDDVVGMIIEMMMWLPWWWDS